MRCRAVLFDMDGTLADTLADIAYAINRALEERGYPTHPLEAFRHFVGDGLALTIERALPQGVEDVPEDLTRTVRQYYRDELGDRCRLYDGIAALLDGLSRRSIATGVVSNKPDWALKDMVARFFSRWSFVYVGGQTPGGRLKPDPTTALEAAAAAGANSWECLFVGDSGVDMETAVNAHMFPAGALWGYRDRDELLGRGARVLLTHPLELLGLIDGDEGS